MTQYAKYKQVISSNQSGITEELAIINHEQATYVRVFNHKQVNNIKVKINHKKLIKCLKCDIKIMKMLII